MFLIDCNEILTKLIGSLSLELRLGAGREAVTVQFVEAGAGAGGGGGAGAGGGGLEPEGGRYVVRGRRMLVLV